MPQTGFFVRIRGKITGPYETEGLRRLIRQGMLSRFHEISADRATWASAGDYEDLFPAPSIPDEAFIASPGPDEHGYDMMARSGEPAFYGAAPPPGASDLPAIPRAPLPVYPSRSRVRNDSDPSAENHRSMALAALILTLAGGILAPLAIVFAIMALNGMRRSGNVDGKGMAMAALVMGIFEAVGMVVAGAILIAMW